ncbi:MAG: alpha-L-arabinofuranosidase C-terminal domain-containing protein, partial [Janthinobacterium lividum]
NLGRGRVLRAAVQSPTYSARYYDPRGPQELYYDLPSVPYLKLAAVHDEPAGMMTIFALNRHLEEDITLDFTASGFGALQVGEATQLRHDDLKATNTKSVPDRVSPAPLPGVQVDGERVSAVLAPASWNVIRLAVKG